MLDVTGLDDGLPVIGEIPRCYRRDSQVNDETLQIK